MNSLLILILTVIELYIWVLIISAVLSWLIAFNVVNTHNRFVYTVSDFLYRVTEPALRAATGRRRHLADRADPAAHFPQEPDLRIRDLTRPVAQIALPLAPAADGVIVTVKLTPRARSAAIDGIGEEPGLRGAQSVLKVRVTAAPESGKANAAMIDLLARSWRLPRTAFAIVSGDTSRLKRVHIAGETPALLREISQRIEAA
jgi:uncharacterized protein (TIGR00251 family)